MTNINDQKPIGDQTNPTVSWNHLSFTRSAKLKAHSYRYNTVNAMPFGKALTYGVFTSTSTIVLRIIKVAEAAFKGLAHLFACAFSKDFRARKGINFLAQAVSAFCDAALKIIFLPISIPYHAFYYTPNNQFSIEVDDGDIVGNVKI